MEKVGTHKRDILIDRVEQATESQEEVKEEFRDVNGGGVIITILLETFNKKKKN